MLVAVDETGISIYEHWDSTGVRSTYYSWSQFFSSYANFARSVDGISLYHHRNYSNVFGGGSISIADGMYTIRASGDTTKTLDIDYGKIDSNYANAQIWEVNQQPNQQFKFEKCDDGAYRITCVLSGKCLDVSGGETANGTNVQQYASNDTGAQRWYVEDAGDGYVRLRNKGSNKYLDISRGDTSIGTNVQIWSGDSSTTAQKFKLVPYADFGTRTTSLADGYYVMRSTINRSYAVDVSGDDEKSGNNLQIFDNIQNAGQVFHFVKQSDSSYKISPLGNESISFDVSGWNLEQGGNISLYTATKGLNQRWIARSCGNGVYAFQSLYSGFFLDVYGGIAASGTNIWQYAGNGSAAQKFYLEPWSNSMSDGRTQVSGVNSSYAYTGSAITPSPSVRWLANSLDSLRVPNSGVSGGAYTNRRVLDAKAGRTYVIEVDKATLAEGSAANGQIRAVDSDGQDVATRVTVKWGSDKQTFTIKPSKDCGLYFYPAPAENTKGCSAQFEGVRVYEQLSSGADYTLSYANNVNAGSASIAIKGAGSFSGSKTIPFQIAAASNAGGSGSSSGKSSGASGAASDSGSQIGASGNAGASKSDLKNYAGKAKAAGFKDLKASDWYMRVPDGAFPDSQTLYLDYTVGRGLMSGYTGSSSGLFGPDDDVSRAMAATIIYRMATGKNAGNTDNSVGTQFSDVPSGQWYSAAIAWCSDKGVVTGYEGTGRFGPDDKVTREQLTAMIARYCQKVGGMASAGSNVSQFKDATAISAWAKAGVAFCAAKGIVSGLGDTGYFQPQGNATRCQMSKIIAVTARMLE